jgi:hypothetical protein
MRSILALAFLSACGASHSTATDSACAPRGTGAPPEGCGFVVNDCCYADGPTACAAAGCADTCMVLESYPAQIRCA